MNEEQAEIKQLREQLSRAYEDMGEITTRLLAVNEAGDLLVSSHDKETLAASLLEVSSRTVGTREGAIFEVVQEGEYELLASQGYPEDEIEAIEANLANMAVCNLVHNEGKSFTVAEARNHESYQEWIREQRESDPDEVIEPTFHFYVPLSLEGEVLGILAMGEREGGKKFGDEEKLVLEHMGSQGALAMDRAQLFAQNEDRLQDLDALLRISRELASTLDLDHVLLTAVNTTAAIVERQRAVIALYQGGKLGIRAVSDFPRVDSGTAEKLGLSKLLEWLSIRQPELINVRAGDLEQNEKLDGREILEGYFAGEMRALLVIGLKDDQGPVGVLLLESFDEGAFDQQADREALSVLAGQLAVSIRNAELYRQLPMVGALAPLAERRRRWRQMTPGQKRRTVLIALIMLSVIALIPWPRSVAGDARVLPSAEVPVRAATEGIIRSIEVRAGERVRAGQLLAQLDPARNAARQAELRAEVLQARSKGAEAEVARDPVERRLAELQRRQTLARLEAARMEGHRADLLAPVDGYIITPVLEEQEGSLLEAGDIFCQVSPLDTLHVEVAISEVDINRIEPGHRLRIKVLAFPDRLFEGEVTSVAWDGEPDRRGSASNFLVRGWIGNPGPSLRSGMTGRARVDVEPATLLWRMSRGLIRFVRLGLWV